MIFVRTGPDAGISSPIACAWNRTTASVSIGWYTPDAPGQGWVRSSIFSPRRSRPLVYADAQSLRLSRSDKNESMRSLAMLSSSSSSMCSARFESCSTGDSPSPSSSPSPKSTVTSPLSMSTSIVGSSSVAIIISTSGSSCGPISNGVITFSMAMAYPLRGLA